MGQYYKPVNIDKNEHLVSYDYANGAKLMEHSYIGNNLVEAVVWLLGNEWSSDRLVWAGDYASDEEGSGANLYQLAGDDGLIVSESEDIYPYILNHSKKEFVAIASVTDDLVIHPLPLLTCEGNGLGGGDFRGRDHNGLVGSWSRDSLQSIKTKDEIPNDYSELVFDLVED